MSLITDFVKGGTLEKTYGSFQKSVIDDMYSGGLLAFTRLFQHVL